MRHLTYATLELLQKTYPELKTYQNFVETGTYKGGTIFPMSKHFKTLHTVEINKKAFDFCQQEANEKGIKNINFHLGDSAELLPIIIPQLIGPIVYFLDGHVTQNNSGFTGKGDKDVPVIEELQAINNLDHKQCLIIIDDMRLLGHEQSKFTAGADWSGITLDVILKQFDSNRIRAHFPDPRYSQTEKKIKNDRYIILLNPKSQ